MRRLRPLLLLLPLAACGGSPSTPSTGGGGGSSTTTITITSAGVSTTALTISRRHPRPVRQQRLAGAQHDVRTRTPEHTQLSRDQQRRAAVSRTRAAKPATWWRCARADSRSRRSAAARREVGGEDYRSLTGVHGRSALVVGPSVDPSPDEFRLPFSRKRRRPFDLVFGAVAKGLGERFDQQPGVEIDTCGGVERQLREPGGERALSKDPPGEFARADLELRRAGVTAVTRPQSSACSASMMSPVRIRCFAQPMPTMRGSRCVAPAPGMMPSPSSGWPNLAVSDAIRMSHASASSQPPPSA